jgi:cytochrome c
MPYTLPASLSDDDTYALVAYILSLNGIVPEGATLNKESLPRIAMPNRGGFIPEPEFRNITNSR